jgi:hypothetical protein
MNGGVRAWDSTASLDSELSLVIVTGHLMKRQQPKAVRGIFYSCDRKNRHTAPYGRVRPEIAAQ